MKHFWVFFFFILSSSVFSQTGPGSITEVPMPSSYQVRLICDSTRARIDAGAGSSSYLWSTGDTTQSIVVYENRVYAVQRNGQTTAADSIKIIFQKQKLNYANNWYFGNGGGLTFSGSDAPTVHNNSENIRFPAGNAVISDNEGKVMFYTDGNTIYNKKDQILASGIKGDSTGTQNSIIVPNPGSIMLYNLFTIRGDSLFQTVVDMLKTPDTLGGIKIKNKFLFQPVDTKLTAVSTADQQGMWLITHQKNSNTFVSFQIKRNPFAPEVVLPPVLSQAGTITDSSEGYLKASSDGKKLAMANNTIQVFDFDNQTGKVSSPVNYNIPNTYGLEFSQDGNLLYASTLDSTLITDSTQSKFVKTIKGGSIFQIALSDTSLKDAGKQIIDTLYSADTLHPAVIGALQMGLDGKIYASIKDSSCLGQIKFPETRDSSNNFVVKGVCFNKTANIDLPNFPQKTSGTGSGIGFTNDAKCARPGEVISVKFLGFSSLKQQEPSLTVTYKYLFDDGTVVNDSVAFHNYVGGEPPKQVTFIVTEGNCKPDTSFGTVVLGPYPNPKILSDTICHGDSITLNAGNPSPDAFYLWKDVTANTFIDFDSTTTIKKGGKYRLIIGFGECIDSSDFTITERQADVNLPTLLPLCPDEIKSIDGGNGLAWTWSMVDTSNVLLQERIFSINKTGRYFLKKTDLKGCKGIDSTDAFSSCEIYVPNAFTPNGTGPVENEIFKAYGHGITKFDMKIFNRWGELIFVSNDINKGWDGFYKGQLSPVGSYAFVIEYEAQGLTTKISGKKKGDVTLLR